MSDTYREPTEQTSEAAPENLESNPETEVENQPQVLVAPEPEVPAPASGTIMEATPPAVENDAERDRALKELMDIAIAKGGGESGVAEAIETAKQFMKERNMPFIVDAFHDYLTRPEIQEQLGIKQL